MWEAIKKLPGSVVITIAALLGVIVLSVIFPERAQLIAVIGLCSVVSVIAFRANATAGFIVTGLMIIALAFWIPKFIQEYNRAHDPNGTFASFFAKAKEQTVQASRTYAPGATSQASIIAAVMSADAKLSGNLDKHLLAMGMTIDSNQLVLHNDQIDTLMSAAGTIKVNQSVFKNVLVAADVINVVPVKPADTLDTLQLDVSDSDGLEYEIPAGQQVTFWVESAWYYSSFDVNTGDSLWCDANGYGTCPRYEDKDMHKYPAPDLNILSVVYKHPGLPWTMAGMHAKHLVENSTESEMILQFTINDKSNGMSKDTGKVEIHLTKSAL